MNTRDIGQQKAFEVLRELGIDPGATVQSNSGLRVVLTIATCAFLQGWVHGLQDAQVQAHVAQLDAQDATLSDPKIVEGFEKLKALLNATRSGKVLGKS